jgi:hypothetical protein
MQIRWERILTQSLVCEGVGRPFSTHMGGYPSKRYDCFLIVESGGLQTPEDNHSETMVDLVA